MIFHSVIYELKLPCWHNLVSIKAIIMIVDQVEFNPIKRVLYYKNVWLIDMIRYIEP